MTAQKTLPPTAAKKPQVFHYPCGEYVDDYAWLRNRNDPDTLDWLAAENEYSEAWMADTAGLRETLYREMRSRMAEEDLSVPVAHGPYEYYQRLVAGEEYPIYCRRRPEGSEEILLDVNRLAADRSYFKLGLVSVSPDHRTLAWSSDENGSEHYTLHFYDLERRENLAEIIHDTSYGSAWSTDGRTFFYTTLDEIERPARVMAHSLETDPRADRLVYEEADKAFFVGLSQGLDGKHVFIEIHTHATAEIRWFQADDPHGKLQIIRPRKPGVLYQVQHREGWFYVLTNEGAINFRLFRIPLAGGGQEGEQPVLHHDSRVYLQYFLALRHALAIRCRVDGKPVLRILDPDSARVQDLVFPEDACQLEIGDNREYDSPWLRLVYQSAVTPRTVYEYQLRSGELEVRKMQEVPGYDARLYESRRIMVPNADGQQIPLALVYRRDRKPDCPQPCFLTAYGSYGICNDPNFSPEIFSLIDRGFVWALAQPRGGGELGRTWYEDGKDLRKKHSFEDFIRCAEWLIDEGWTTAGQLCIHGRSAGGLLIGAVINLRPDLFRAAILGVPFVDTLNTMMDPSLPLTTIEYDEWGDPNRPEVCEYIRSYSPYDNVRAQNYPALLFQGGLHDPRVGYWEPAKMTARLRERKTDNQILLLQTKMGEGHSTGAARFEKLKDIAYRYAFFLKILGMNEDGVQEPPRPSSQPA